MSYPYPDKIEVHNFPDMASAPNAADWFAEHGTTPFWVNGIQYVSNGSIIYSLSGEFTPSIYSAAKSATVTVSGQSEAIATGATKLEAVNDDATNSVYIGFGNSAALAEAACSSGVAGVSRFLILPKARMHKTVSGYSHYAWLGVGGTVSVRITQGV